MGLLPYLKHREENGTIWFLMTELCFRRVPPKLYLAQRSPGNTVKWMFCCSQPRMGLTSGISRKLPGEAAALEGPRPGAKRYGSTALWWSGVWRWPWYAAFRSEGIFYERVNGSENFSHPSTWMKRAQESSEQGWICQEMENPFLMPFQFIDSPSF